jgi:hypothetical protein
MVPTAGILVLYVNFSCGDVKRIVGILRRGPIRPEYTEKMLNPRCTMVRAVSSPTQEGAGIRTAIPLLGALWPSPAEGTDLQVYYDGG